MTEENSAEPATAGELAEEARKWLADQQRWTAEYFDKYYGMEHWPGNPDDQPRPATPLVAAPLPQTSR